MVFEGELVVIDPNRVPVVWHPFQTLAVAGDVLKLGEDVGLDPIEVDTPVLPFEWCCV
jgi:hypothetical protein